MMSISVTFWMFVVTFAIIGATRGWVKELMVMFSVILSIFLLNVLETFTPLFTVLQNAPAMLFWVKVAVIFGLAFFGYQSPKIPQIAATGKLGRDRLQDILLGFVIGGLNGFLIFGTAWFFMDKAGYPFPIIASPTPGTAIGDASIKMLAFLPPQWLVSPYIYFAVGLAFVFVLVVFI